MPSVIATKTAPRPSGEGDVAPPVDAAGLPFAVVTQLAVGPHRSEDPDRHVDPEHRAPIEGREQAAGRQADELAGERGDLVDAEREAALIDWKRVGQDRGRVRGQHRTADRLRHPPADEPQCAMATVVGIERQHDRRRREHHEAGVVDLHPAEHVAETADGDDEHRLDQPVAHDHPQQVADVAGRQRIEPDAAKDRRQRDEHDRTVEGRHEHGQRRIRQRDPLVAVVVAAVARRRQDSPHLEILCESLDERRRRHQLLQFHTGKPGRQGPCQLFGARGALAAQRC